MQGWHLLPVMFIHLSKCLSQQFVHVECSRSKSLQRLTQHTFVSAGLAVSRLFTGEVQSVVAVAGTRMGRETRLTPF